VDENADNYRNEIAFLKEDLKSKENYIKQLLDEIQTMVMERQIEPGAETTLKLRQQVRQLQQLNNEQDIVIADQNKKIEGLEADLSAFRSKAPPVVQNLVNLDDIHNISFESSTDAPDPDKYMEAVHQVDVLTEKVQELELERHKKDSRIRELEQQIQLQGQSKLAAKSLQTNRSTMSLTARSTSSLTADLKDGALPEPPKFEDLFHRRPSDNARLLQSLLQHNGPTSLDMVHTSNESVPSVPAPFSSMASLPPKRTDSKILESGKGKSEKYFYSNVTFKFIFLKLISLDRE
jgi:hypothetical protein